MFQTLNKEDAMKRMTWTVVFRDGPDTPQQELVRYTEEAATTFAQSIIDNGGVAIVVEDDEEDLDIIITNNGSRSGLTWD